MNKVVIVSQSGDTLYVYEGVIPRVGEYICLKTGNRYQVINVTYMPGLMEPCIVVSVQKVEWV